MSKHILNVDRITHGLLGLICLGVALTPTSANAGGYNGSNGTGAYTSCCHHRTNMSNGTGSKKDHHTNMSNGTGSKKDHHTNMSNGTGSKKDDTNMSNGTGGKPKNDYGSDKASAIEQLLLLLSIRTSAFEQASKQLAQLSPTSPQYAAAKADQASAAKSLDQAKAQVRQFLAAQGVNKGYNPTW